MLIEKCKHTSRSNNIQIKLKSGTISCRHSNSYGNLLQRCYDHLRSYYAQHCDPTRHLHRHGHHDYYGRRMCYLLSLMAVVLGVILLPLPQRCNAVGYSYTRFRGPVSGPEHRIYVRNGVASSSAASTHDHHPDEETHLDYVAKPEYEFAYGVEDTQAHILHNRNEMRDGDAVKGVYSVVDPDGTLRVVRYTADDVNGFQAEVVRNGISAIHGQLQKDTPAPSHIPTDYKNHYGYNRYPSLNSYSSDNYNNYQNPGYYYPASVNHVTPPTSTTTSDNNYNNYQNYEDQNYEDPNVNPEDNVEYVNVEDNGEYHPQYEVHEEEPSSNEGNVKEEGEKENNKGGGGKKKDYDDDDDEDGDEEDDYDDSEELEDYDEAVKKNKGSDESDEYY